MSAYPSTLPLPLQDGYSIQRQSGDMMLQPFSGLSMVVSMTDDEPSVFSVQWNLDQAGADTFFDWFENDLNYGELPFTIPLFIEAGIATQTAVFVADSVTGFDAVEYNRYVISGRIFVSVENDPDLGEYELLLALAGLDEQGDPEDAMLMIDEAINEVWI